MITSESRFVRVSGGESVLSSIVFVCCLFKKTLEQTNRYKLMDDNTQQPSMPIVDEYKGNKILVLNPGSRFPFSFGVAKAKLVVEHIEAIKKFIAEYDKKPG